MRTFATVLVVAASLGMASSPASACGDKLLVIGRRVKRIPPAKHPASVLLYLRPGSALPAAAKEMDLESTLRRAGHQVDTIDGAERLHERLAAGTYDFVLTDLPDANAVALEASSAPGRAVVVPVAFEVDRQTLRSSRESFGLVIEAGHGRSYLSALDSAMRSRERAEGH